LRGAVEMLRRLRRKELDDWRSLPQRATNTQQRATRRVISLEPIALNLQP